MLRTSFLWMVLASSLGAASFNNFQPGQSGVYNYPSGSDQYYMVSNDTVAYWPLSSSGKAVYPLGADFNQNAGTVTFPAYTGSRWGYACRSGNAAVYLSPTAAAVTAIQAGGAAYTIEFNFRYNNEAGTTRSGFSILNGAATLINFTNAATYKLGAGNSYSLGDNTIIANASQFAKFTCDGVLVKKIWLDGVDVSPSTPTFLSLATATTAAIGGRSGSSSFGNASNIWDLRIRNVYDNTGTKTADTYLGKYNSKVKLGRGLTLGM